MNAFAARFELALSPSPLVDRRALSQAWYDALHLVEADAASRAGHGDVPLADARLFHPGKVCSPTFPSRHPWLREKLERRTGNVSHVRHAHSEVKIKSERRDQLARKIIKEFIARPGVTQFVIKTAQGRVCLFVLRNAHGVHVAAVCPPAMRARIEGALAQARCTLAGMRVVTAC